MGRVLVEALIPPHHAEIMSRPPGMKSPQPAKHAEEAKPVAMMLGSSR